MVVATSVNSLVMKPAVIAIDISMPFENTASC